ncbi:MAG: SDR family oxidoreductase [Planctomycetota bacterium]
MTLSQSLNGKHALVCGASSGIGREIALAMAAQGARLSFFARSAEKLTVLAEECLAVGAETAVGFPVDLEDADALASATASVLQQAGPVHILINNSGGPPGGPLLNAFVEDFLAPLRRHLFAAHYLVQQLVAGMQEEGYGRILNIISTSVKEPIAGLGVSNTVRGAVAAWAKTLSKELPTCVTINNLLPGFTATDRLDSLRETVAGRQGISADEVEANWLATVPAGRLGDPRELAALAAFLASPAGAFVRGQSIAVDGGRLNGI